MPQNGIREVIIIGGGPAGLSAAIYLGRARRDTLLIDSGKSMARWEPSVDNCFGFPDGISGPELIRRGREQAARWQAELVADEIQIARLDPSGFFLQGLERTYRAENLLIATGSFHIPPEIKGVSDCLGKSL